ncbi:retinoic acid early transcript 1E-like isoform X3 [Dama dama]|uniref:retinoic acid early transcript 1E-like isoform X3 n=1 Tax=Dama dama TaxID=30532 RepID=UPI002A364050|nr:retinoic acid early transcript 1E-like isoform X3 [Dama dama]
MLLKLQGGRSLAHTTGHLLLTLLLTEAGKTLGNAHSLCLDLTVKKQSRPGQPSCQVQGSMDTKPFLQYDSDSNKVRPLGFLGEEVNDTKAWTELSQMVGEARRELRMVLPVIKLDKKEMRGPPSLQVRLCCQREAQQCSGASLLFSLNGHTALLLDTMSITWTGIDPGATGLKEEWENSQELAEYFRKISVGDCSYWLRELLEHWENMLFPEPTGERNVDTDRRDRYRKTRPTGRVSWKDRNRHELRNAKGFREPQSCPRYLGRVRLFAAPWTAAHQAPLSVGFFRQEYWGGLPFPSPCNHQ